MAVAVKICGKREVEECLKEFLQERGWAWIPVQGDGNCFFRAVAEYYERSNHGIKPNYTELRQQVADFIETKIYEGDPDLPSTIIALEMTKKNEKQGVSPEEIIERALGKIRTDRVWKAQSFEIVPHNMAKALGVNIDIYDARSYKNPKKEVWSVKDGITEYRMTEFQPTKIEVNYLVPEAPSPIHINLLRTHEGHYDLLWPSNGPHAAAAAMKNNNEKVNNSMGAQLQKLQQIENNAKFAQQLQKLSIENNVSPKKKKSSKPKVVHKNPFFNNVASLKLSPKASPKSHHSNSSFVSNASNVSSVSSYNGYPIENIQQAYPHKDRTLTRNKLKGLLNEYGIEYAPKNLRNTLYSKFIMAFKENVNKKAKRMLKESKKAKKYANKVASRKASKKKISP